jgi:hypothetical protein
MKRSTFGLLAGVLGSAFAFWVNRRFAHRLSMPVSEPAQQSLSGTDGVPGAVDCSYSAEGII